MGIKPFGMVRRDHENVTKGDVIQYRWTVISEVFCQKGKRPRPIAKVQHSEFPNCLFRFDNQCCNVRRILHFLWHAINMVPMCLLEKHDTILEILHRLNPLQPISNSDSFYVMLIWFLIFFSRTLLFVNTVHAYYQVYKLVAEIRWNTIASMLHIAVLVQ